MPTNVVDLTRDCFNRFPLMMESMIKVDKFDMGDIMRCMSQKRFQHSYSVKRARSTSCIVQAFQCPFTPNGSMEMDSHTYGLCKMKIDLQWTCDDIQQWYESSMHEWYDNTSNASQNNWRYVRWMITNIVMPQYQEDRFRMRWGAVRQDPIPGVPGDCMTACNGLCWEIERGVDAAQTTPIPTGILEKATIVEQIKCFTQSLPKKYRNNPNYKVLTSCDIAYCFSEALNERRQYCCEYDQTFTTRIPNTPYTLVGVRELQGTNALIMTTQGNMFESGRTGEGQTPTLYFEKDKRNLCAMGEIHGGYGIQCWEDFWINDTYKEETVAFEKPVVTAPVAPKESKISLVAA